MSARAGSPLVYVACRALDEAQQLLPPGICVENEIEHWITSGLVQGERNPVFAVTSPCRRFQAIITRRPGRFRPKPRCWWVLAIRRNPDHRWR